MSDTLYLNLWFPSFDPEEILPRTVSVLRQFPFSAVRPGISYFSVHPVDWSETTILEHRFITPADPAEVAEQMAEFAEPDYALLFETAWDLWMPDDRGEWTLRPSRVTFIANGPEFDDGAFRQEGHIQVDFGQDFPFLYEELDLKQEDEEHVKANVAKLVEFTHKVEQNCNLRGRILWSESEENLAQKLVARLQRVQ
jgi:hypothetical protein